MRVIVASLILSLSLTLSCRAATNIDDDLFSKNVVRLNQEIYDETELVVNKNTVKDINLATTTGLGQSFIDNLTPLTPMALTVCETGLWMDTRYTWTSAIYSGVLANSGVDMSNIRVKTINSNTYLSLGLDSYLGCQSNCTNPLEEHIHFSGSNDNDSLGPLQILRRYVETDGILIYDNKASVTDLMRYQDSLVYYVNNQVRAFNNSKQSIESYVIKSPYQAVMLSAVAHNTGTSFLATSIAGSTWIDTDNILKFSDDVSHDINIAYLKEYTNVWWESVKSSVSRQEKFSLMGQCSSQEIDNLLREMSIDKSSYSTSFGHKQEYPVRALLNYMSLERLYNYSEDKV